MYLYDSFSTDLRLQVGLKLRASDKVEKSILYLKKYISKKNTSSFFPFLFFLFNLFFLQASQAVSVDHAKWLKVPERQLNGPFKDETFLKVLKETKEDIDT